MNPAVYKMMKIFTAIIACIFLLAGRKVCSQNDIRQFTGELNIKFQSVELNKIERALDILNEADARLEKANAGFSALTEIEKKERSSSGYRNALKRLFESSESYREANNLVFSVFSDKTNSFWQKMNRNNHRASGMDKARYYEGRAIKMLNRSLIRWQQVIESDRYEYSLGIMKDAINLGRMAVREQGRALQICSDYPVEYNYGWEDDLTLEQIVAIMKGIK